jgi:hypothetical protein
MIKYKNLQEHIKFIASAFKRRGEFYRKRGLELSPTTHTFLWSRRRYLLSAGTRAALVWDRIAGESPTIEKWHSATVTHKLIVRRIQDVLVDHQSATMSRFAVACEDVAKRETVRRCITMGVELGLLEKRPPSRYTSDVGRINRHRPVHRQRRRIVRVPSHFLRAFYSI